MNGKVFRKLHTSEENVRREGRTISLKEKAKTKEEKVTGEQ
jgi:hypothetical protein